MGDLFSFSLFSSSSTRRIYRYLKARFFRNQDEYCATWINQWWSKTQYRLLVCRFFLINDDCKCRLFPVLTVGGRVFDRTTTRWRRRTTAPPPATCRPSSSPSPGPRAWMTSSAVQAPRYRTPPPPPPPGNRDILVRVNPDPRIRSWDRWNRIRLSYWVTLRMQKNYFSTFFSYNLLTGTLSSVLKI